MGAAMLTACRSRRGFTLYRQEGGTCLICRDLFREIVTSHSEKWNRCYGYT
jgi:hypothetical protein